MVEPLRHEVGVELAVDHPQDVAVELGGDAGRIVVGRARGGRGPSPGRCRAAGCRPVAWWPRGRRGTAPARPARGCRWCRRGTRRAAARPAGSRRGGARSRRRRRARRGPGSGRAIVSAASLQERPRSRRRARSGEPARGGEGVEQDAGLLGRARAELDQRVGAASARRWWPPAASRISRSQRVG